MYILKRIIRNKFLTSKQHEYLVRYWGKIQRHYYVLSRFVTKIKYRYCKSITDNDLCLESLDDLSASIVISVIDNNALYRFRMSDIINIVNAKLSHAPDFFAEPLPITNPYTNDYFTDSQLYNIYFKIKHSTYIMPHLFHMFFLSGFNINDFLNDNEATLRDFTIERYTKTLTEEQKFKHIKNLVEQHRTTIPSVNTLLKVAPKKCKDNIILHMTPMIKDYLHCKFSLLPSKKFQCYEQLRKKLRRLNRSIFRNEVDMIKRDTPFARPNGMSAHSRWGVLYELTSNQNANVFDRQPFVFGQDTITFDPQTTRRLERVRRNLTDSLNSAVQSPSSNPSDVDIYNHNTDDEEDGEETYNEGNDEDESIMARLEQGGLRTVIVTTSTDTESSTNDDDDDDDDDDDYDDNDNVIHMFDDDDDDELDENTSSQDISGAVVVRPQSTFMYPLFPRRSTPISLPTNILDLNPPQIVRYSTEYMIMDIDASGISQTIDMHRLQIIVDNL